MEWLFEIPYLIEGSVLLGGGLLAVGLWQVYLYERGRLQTFVETVERYGLQMVRISAPLVSRMKLEAQAGPVSVVIEELPKLRTNEYGMVVVVRFPGPPGFAGVRIRREKDKPPGAREVEVGDERFDSAFYIEGPTRLLSVLLDAEARHVLANVNAKGRLLIAGGEIRVETWEFHYESVLSLLLQLTRRFMAEINIAQRLAENARQDPVPGVRLRNLLVLIREFPAEPGTREILRAACADSSTRVRLRAAMELGPEGREVLFEVAESLKDDESSAQAVAHLGRDLPFERTRALLAVSLRKPHLQTARACLEAIGTSGDPAAVDALTGVLGVESELAAAAALALGETGSPAAEPPLLQALQSARPDLQVAAATALGRVGSAAAVLPLKDAAESAPRDKDLHRAARQAIAEIQSRLQGALPGQLSLAGGEGGQLSLAEGGQLSLASDPAGQLSMAQAEVPLVPHATDEPEKPPRNARETVL